MNEPTFTSAVSRITAQDSAFFADSFSQEALLASAARIEAVLEQDIDSIRQNAHVLFSTEANVETGKDLATLFTAWRDRPVSTVALIYVAANILGINKESKEFAAAVLAGIAAGVPNDHPYHDNSHFREVTAVMLRLCVQNKNLCEKNVRGTVPLTPEDMAKCLMAAAGHDLMHDGKGNAPGGMDNHEQYRLERKAIAAIEPFMKLADFSLIDREDISVMIHITDITERPGQKSPRQLLKEAYDQFLSNDQKVTISLPPELEALRTRPNLLIMATFMSDADLGPTLATCTTYASAMTQRFCKEMFNRPAKPEDIQFFNDHILKQQGALSLAGTEITADSKTMKEALSNLISNPVLIKNNHMDALTPKKDKPPAKNNMP